MAVAHFEIRPITYKQAMDVVCREHYLHRKAPCSFAFGLFDGHEMIGVICYGTPSSAPLRRGICGPEEKDNVIELTRLWIKDGTPKNSESFLIGNTIPLVNKEVIVSFAEIGAGHVGTVYQATNWIYTGLSAKRTNWHVEGATSHNQTLTDKFTSAQMKEIHGDAFVLVDRPRKHRYVYFNCNKRRRKALMQKLKYPVMRYPKLTVEPSPQPKAEPDWQEEFAHRAAILEYDGSFSRREAEEEAGYWVEMQKREWRKRH